MPPTDDLETLRAEVERLRAKEQLAEDLFANLDVAIYHRLVSSSDYPGWKFASVEPTDRINVRLLAPILVAAGRWERHPEMAWLYRRKETTNAD